MKNLNYAEAVVLVEAALESKSIPLKGSESAPDQAAAKERAEIDAAYLLTLFRRLLGEVQ